MTERDFKIVSNTLKKQGIIKVGVSLKLTSSPVVGVYSDEGFHILSHNDELYDLCLGVFYYLKNKEKEESDKARHEALMEREYNDFLKQCDPTELPW